MVNRMVDVGASVTMGVTSKVENIVQSSASKEHNVIKENQLVQKSEVSEEVLTSEKAKKMTRSLNDFLETTTTKLRYEHHEELDKYYVTLVDRDTEQVVREIPNKKLMDMYAAMLEFVGVFIDKKI